MCIPVKLRSQSISFYGRMLETRGKLSLEAHHHRIHSSSSLSCIYLTAKLCWLDIPRGGSSKTYAFENFEDTSHKSQIAHTSKMKCCGTFGQLCITLECVKKYLI